MNLKKYNLTQRAAEYAQSGAKKILWTIEY